jgi:hypothetical protein
MSDAPSGRAHRPGTGRALALIRNETQLGKPQRTRAIAGAPRSFRAVRAGKAGHPQARSHQAEPSSPGAAPRQITAGPPRFQAQRALDPVVVPAAATGRQQACRTGPAPATTNAVRFKPGIRTYLTAPRHGRVSNVTSCGNRKIKINTRQIECIGDRERGAPWRGRLRRHLLDPLAGPILTHGYTDGRTLPRSGDAVVRTVRGRRTGGSLRAARRGLVRSSAAGG